MDVALTILIWLAIGIVAIVGLLIVLALIIACVNLARFGDARGPSSKRERDVAAAWTRTLEQDHTVNFAPGSPSVRLQADVFVDDARVLGLMGISRVQ